MKTKKKVQYGKKVQPKKKIQPKRKAHKKSYTGSRYVANPLPTNPHRMDPIVVGDTKWDKIREPKKRANPSILIQPTIWGARIGEHWVERGSGGTWEVVEVGEDDVVIKNKLGDASRVVTGQKINRYRKVAMVHIQIPKWHVPDGDYTPHKIRKVTENNIVLYAEYHLKNVPKKYMGMTVVYYGIEDGGLKVVTPKKEVLIVNYNQLIERNW